MESHDKRREYRQDSGAKAFVQIIASQDEALIGTTLSCLAYDISANGLRIEAGQEIPNGCQLDLWIDNAAGPGKFFLSSTVRWVKLVDGQHQVGVELHEGAATDIDSWREQRVKLS